MEYGIGVRIDGVEQFRQIYKGKAHKCIITDLMPRTQFRLRVVPILNVEGEDPVMGPWSHIENVPTRDVVGLDLTQPCAAALVQPGVLLFDKPGIVLGTYGFSFGEHLWALQIKA